MLYGNRDVPERLRTGNYWAWVQLTVDVIAECARSKFHELEYCRFFL